MIDWLHDTSPKMREAVKIAKRASVSGDYQVIENGYAHECEEPDKLGRAKCCDAAGSETLINPTPWQLIQGTARATGRSVSELFGRTIEPFEDDDIKLSRKWKNPSFVVSWRDRRSDQFR